PSATSRGIGARRCTGTSPRRSRSSGRSMTDSPPPDWRAILGSATPRVSFGNPGVRPMRKISDTQEWWDQTIMVRGPFRPSKADAIARMDRKALTLYLIGNHYTAEMRPENLRFGAPLKGGSPDEVKHPPKVRVGKARSHTPFRWLRPPTSHGLHALRKQIDDFVENNVAHEMKAGGRLRTNAKRRIAVRLDQ